MLKSCSELHYKERRTAWRMQYFCLAGSSPLPQNELLELNTSNMKYKNILIVMMMLMGSVLYAQNQQNMAPSRMLKTASSLVEAQQYEAAESYYKKGLAAAIKNKDIYYQAQAYEGLGNLYSRLTQKKQAAASYEKAIKLYRSQGLSVIADVLESLLKGLHGEGELYAGVEVGAKGIKLSVIELQLHKDSENDYILKTDTSINTDAAALSYQSEVETRNAIAVFYQIIKTRYDIAYNKIHIVISSGLKQDLDRYGKTEYFAQVIRPKELDSRIRINYITPRQEAELSFRGIVPQKNRLTADQLDVGSGNTKGGYFDESNSFVPVTFALGTKSFQRLIESKAQGSLEEFLESAKKIMDDSLARLMVYEFANKTEFKTRDVVYLSGGIVWSIASLMYPEKINDNYVEITASDIAAFRKKVYSDYMTLITPDVSKTLDAKDATTTLRNINRVIKTYDQKAMLAGAIWLDELIQQVNTRNPGKKFIYPRYAYVGWISGYIMDKINKQYMTMASN